MAGGKGGGGGGVRGRIVLNYDRGRGTIATVLWVIAQGLRRNKRTILAILTPHLGGIVVVRATVIVLAVSGHCPEASPYSARPSIP